MRELNAHKTNGANETLKILVTDEPGHGGANHRYEITGFDTLHNAAAEQSTDFRESNPIVFQKMFILFQNGPIKEAGINGVTQEALLAVVIDRLRSFQAGPFACYENDQALAYAEKALFWLKKRTSDRIQRGVEGEYKP